MPKKSANAHSGVQRNKPKVQKSFELVRPERDMSEKAEKSNVTATLPVSTLVTTPEKEIIPQRRAPVELSKQAEDETPLVKGSAAARMAARRRAAQKAQQRSASSLLTAEHFAYVRRDLITIAILACIMFTAIITFYLTIGQA